MASLNEQSALSRLRILVVEDVYLIAVDLADQLEGLDCDVIGPVPSMKRALERIDGVRVDGAVLDVNLAGERSFPLAEVLAVRNVPFAFLTGYDSDAVIPEKFRYAPRLFKPVNTKSLSQMLTDFRNPQGTTDEAE